MNDKIKDNLVRFAYAVSWIVIICFSLLMLFVGYRVFICDRFIVPSASMAPTLIPGDRILVNKLIFGARIYKNYDFSDGQPLESWRMPGLRRIKPNDVLVFNVPFGYYKDMIEFKINYVYTKRCIGTPGDTVSIEGGFYKNNNYKGDIGLHSEQSKIAAIPDSLISVLPMFCDNNWTIREFGPLYVPAMGDTVRFDKTSYRLYERIIEYETHKDLSIVNGKLSLGDTSIERYVFRENYYFAGGDNVMSSNDSRYWGFVPEEFIIGVADRIAYSDSRRNGRFHLNRIRKKIDQKP